MTHNAQTCKLVRIGISALAAETKSKLLSIGTENPEFLSIVREEILSSLTDHLDREKLHVYEWETDKEDDDYLGGTVVYCDECDAGSVLAIGLEVLAIGDTVFSD